MRWLRAATSTTFVKSRPAATGTAISGTATRTVLGVDIPLITVPVAAGRDLTNVVEVAALNLRLKQMGHNAAKELDEKLKAALARKD